MRYLTRVLKLLIRNHPYPTPTTCGICGGPIPCLKH